MKKVEKGEKNFLFPFQRRARSTSPPKQAMIAKVITQKLFDTRSPPAKHMESFESLMNVGLSSKLDAKKGPIKAE